MTDGTLTDLVERLAARHAPPNLTSFTHDPGADLDVRDLNDVDLDRVAGGVSAVLVEADHACLSMDELLAEFLELQPDATPVTIRHMP